MFGTSKFNAATGGQVTVTINVEGDPVQLASYAIKSANDAPGRDPRTWQLVAVDANGREHVIHNMDSTERKWGNNDDKRWSWMRWSVDHNFPASKFLLKILTNNGDGGCTQMG